MDFEILINDSFINTDPTLSSNRFTNNYILSLVNDYEDGKWRYAKFQQFIWNNIAETALSYKERESLIGMSASILAESAKKLRLSDKAQDISNGSELAEIVLYGLMRKYYNALPVVPKIYYKQNSQDNAKGSDSVHITIEGEDFSLWFGEAKFYNSIDDTRLYEIIKSVKNSLNTEKIKKENSIITNLIDIDLLVDDEKLSQKIKSSLSSQNSIDNLKTKLNIPILLLHECEITKKHQYFTSEYKEEIIEYHRNRSEAYFKKQTSLLSSILPKYSEIKFHIILFPVPNKENIVKTFLNNVEFHKSQG